MIEYKITSASGQEIAKKMLRGDVAAAHWRERLIRDGVISGVAIRLLRRTMTDAEADLLPPFANGQKQSAWKSVSI